MRRPSELLWPDPAVRALFGDDAGAVVEDSVVSDLPNEARARLGFLSVEALSPRQIAQRLGDAGRGDRVARPALLTLLESGLQASRFTRHELAQALRDRLVIRDDEGVTRPITEVCVRGSRELFGHGRGDVSFLSETPLLTRALSIPEVPDLGMMLAFLGEQGETLASLSLDEKRDLARHLPEIYRRLAERSRKGTQVALPARAAVVAMHGGENRVVSLDNPDLRLPQPSTVADALEQADLDRLWLVSDVEPALQGQLLAAGVPDLLSGATVVAIERGVRVPALADAAEQLHAHLARGLGERVGRRVEARERLSTTFRLALPTGETRVTADVDAAIDGDTLLVTEAAISDPGLIASALETEPRRRVALWEWLSGDLRDNVSRRAEPPRNDERARGWLSRVKRFFGVTEDEPARPHIVKPSIATPAAKSRAKKRRTSEATDPRRDAAMFRPQHEITSQLEDAEGWIEARAKRPAFGFRFAPESLPSPWLYAPKLVATQFDRRSQSWQPLPLERPASRGSAGAVRLRGTLPEGESVLPIPLYGRLTGFSPAEASRFPSTVGGSTVRLAEGGAVTMEVVLGIAPDAASARVADVVDATRSFVPDDELPEEVLAFLEDLEDTSPLETAHAIRDFVRRRYRYDPTYLEDAAVGRWLARVARGRASVHVAALHAAADGEYLGAGVCHELNTLTCEMLRRASIPAGIATGWVFTGGSLSEPDHLWVTVFLEGPRGEPIWVPIDASTTTHGRPLRVARRPPVRGMTATERRAAPKPPPWATSDARAKKKTKAASQVRSRPAPAARTKKERKPPRAELRRLLRYLERRTGRALTDDETRELEAALQDPRGREELLARLLGKS